MDEDFRAIFAKGTLTEEDNSNSQQNVETQTIEEPVQPETETVDEVKADPPEVAAPPVEEQAQPETVPVAVLMAERAKLNGRLQDRERELDEWKSRLAALEAEKTAKPAPDPFDDPNGFAQHQQQLTQQTVDEQINAYKFGLSHQMALREYGEDKVRTASEWAAQLATSDESFFNAAKSQVHPIEWIIQQHERHTELNEFMTNRDELIRREAIRLGLYAPEATATAAAPAKTNQDVAKSKAPPSLVHASNVTAAAPRINDEESFRSIFRK